MARNYGKYSEAERGWLYVDEATKLTYLVTVVQQKTVNGKDGEELYFVTSGHTINTELDNDDSFYGVFEVQRSNGRLWEFSDPRRPSGTIPVTPENVLFEALSADVWGWVVKISDVESSDGSDLNASTNVVLAPYDGGIAVLGSRMPRSRRCTLRARQVYATAKRSRRKPGKSCLTRRASPTCCRRS